MRGMIRLSMLGKTIQLTAGMAFFLLMTQCAHSTASDVPYVITRSDSHFIFRYHPQDFPYIKPIMKKAEMLWTEITHDIGTVPTQPITVIMAFTEMDFNQFQPGSHPFPDWVQGVAYPNQNLMVIRSPRLLPGYQKDTVQVFTHELTHLILAHKFKDQPIPRWLNEGLAMYESYEWHPSQDILMGKYVLSRRLIPLNELTRAFSAPFSEVQQAYLQSYSLVNYMISKHGLEAFHHLLTLLSHGESFDLAIQQVFNLSPEEFETQWKKYLRLRYNWIPLLTSSGLFWLLISLLLIASFLYRRRRNKRILEKWSEEEKELLD
jgi:hypothetical protein